MSKDNNTVEQITALEAENKELHRKLAHAELEVCAAWSRYEAANSSRITTERQLEEANKAIATQPVACKRCNSYVLLASSLEEQIDIHREREAKYYEAIKTLESEREANARLTAELEATQLEHKMPIDMSEDKRMIVQLRGLVEDLKAQLCHLQQTAPVLTDEQILELAANHNIGWTAAGIITPYLPSEAQEYLAFARALLQHTAAPSILQGWKLVPIEPTEEMVKAGTEAARAYYAMCQGYRPSVIYEAMLATAPAVPTV